MASKTLAQLTVSANLLDGDLLCNFRGTGPLTSFTTQVMRTYLNGFYLQSANNLSDLSNVPTARANLGLGSAALQPASAFALSGTTATAGAGLTGGGTLNANFSFAVDILGQTTDAGPNPAADYVMTYSASGAGLRKVLLNNFPVAFTQLATFPISGTPATISFTSISQGYRELLFVFQEVTHNSGGSANINAAISTSNGGAYTGTVVLMSVPTTQGMIGTLRIPAYAKGYGSMRSEVQSQATPAASPFLTAASSSGSSWDFKATGGINAVQFSVSASLFVAGTITVYGI